MRCNVCHRRILASCPVHGGVAAEPVHGPAWPGIAGLVPVRVLGAGGGGVVWGCSDRTGRVAVKIAATGMAERLEREHEALTRLGPPNTPQFVRTARTDDGASAIVIEWLDGETLADRLAALGDGRSLLDELVPMLARRIDALHAAGVAHRDLKPENIWLEPSGEIRLLDLGLAAVDAPRTATIAGTSIGTSAYMAPEQVLGEPSGRAADIYAFGAILFELVTGRPPFVGGDARINHVSRRPLAPSELVPCAAPLDAVVTACLAKNPAHRPMTAREVAAAISEASAPLARDVARARSRRCEVVLAAITRPRQLDVIASAVRDLGGCIARVHRDCVVVAFPGIAAARGTGLARALLEKLDAVAVIRTAELRVRAGSRVVLSGAALEDLSWCFADDARTRVPSSATASCEAVGLVGRERLVCEIVDEVTHALATSTPIVVTLTGAPGVGTSRVLEEIVTRLSVPVVRGPIGALPVEPTVFAIDDGHRLAIDTLDALERAVASGAPLAVVMAAHAALYDHRPLWAEHAPIARRITIEPLDDAETDNLLLALLSPIELVAEPALARLRGLVHGIPGNAVEIVRQLRDAGAVRQFGAGGWYLAHDELVGPTPFAVQLARRALDAQPPDLRRLAQIAAVLADGITPARVDALRRDDLLDSGVGLSRLAGLGIVVENDGAWRVRHELLRDALEATIPHAECAELHRLAWRALDGVTGSHALAARARHALGAGATGEAAIAQLELAELARHEHRDVDAERAYSAALAHLEDPAARLRALVGRGKIRYRLHRFADAADDLAAARPLVDEHADLATRIDVRLEQATVADWRERWDESAVFAEQAFELTTTDPELARRIVLARGRSAFRQGRLDAARALLEAATLGEGETSTIAKMLLGTTLVWAGDIEAARQVLDEVIDGCEATGDRLHLCSALNDRMWVWFKCDAVDRAVDDQRRATELARQLGHAHLERCSTYNLAELLYWRGEHAEALPLALRSRSLQDRFVGTSPLDALLVARIHASCDERELAAAAIAWVDATCEPLTGAVAMQRDLIALVLASTFDAGAWQALLGRARETTVLYELPEALWFAARAAARADHALATAWIADGRASVSARDHAWHLRFSAVTSPHQKEST